MALEANLESEQALQELHQLLELPQKRGLTVGELVQVAISMGLLDNNGKPVMGKAS